MDIAFRLLVCASIGVQLSTFAGLHWLHATILATILFGLLMVSKRVCDIIELIKDSEPTS